MFDALILLMMSTGLLLGSPGPAPMALAATSASYGIQKTLPFLTGILTGLLVVIVGTALGLAGLIESHQWFKTALQILGAGYIVYVALKIARGPVLSINDEPQNHPGFRDGFILNILNPKAYAAFLALFSQFRLPFDTVWMSFMLSGTVCFVVALVVDSLWVLLGAGLRRCFSHPLWARVLRISFGLMMLISVYIAMRPMF